MHLADSHSGWDSRRDHNLLSDGPSDVGQECTLQRGLQGHRRRKQI